MSEKNQDPNLRDENLAAEERPVPSQAEGDRDTVDQDLRDKERTGKAKTASTGSQK